MTDARTLPLLGDNTFVWCSPLDDSWLRSLAPKIADWGFGAVELPLESIGDWGSLARPESSSAPSGSSLCCAR